MLCATAQHQCVYVTTFWRLGCQWITASSIRCRSANLPANSPTVRDLDRKASGRFMQRLHSTARGFAQATFDFVDSLPVWFPAKLVEMCKKMASPSSLSKSQSCTMSTAWTSEDPPRGPGAVQDPLRREKKGQCLGAFFGAFELLGVCGRTRYFQVGLPAFPGPLCLDVWRMLEPQAALACRCSPFVCVFI